MNRKYLTIPPSPDSRRRLKAWPEWAAGEYQVALKAARRLHMEAKVALERGVGGHRNIPLLQRLLQRLAQHARDAELAALRVEAERRDDEGRWPRWAIYALWDILDLGNTASKQAERACQALKQDQWADMERLLNACLQAGQQMEQVLLYGPPPEGVSVMDDEEGAEDDSAFSSDIREE